MQRLGFTQLRGSHTLRVDRVMLCQQIVGELGPWDKKRRGNLRKEQSSLPISSLLGRINQGLVTQAMCLWQPEQPKGTGKLAGTLVWYMLAETLRWRRGGEMNEGQGGNDLGQSGSLPLTHI